MNFEQQIKSWLDLGKIKKQEPSIEKLLRNPL